MPSFSGHETFPLRFTWLAKAVEAVETDPDVFGDDAAIATFGVGRNMVRAIKHWAVAASVLESEGGGTAVPTDVGRLVFRLDGADPYCEDPATHWLLHWLLCRDPDRATLWHFVFGHWRSGALDLRSLRSALGPWLHERGADLPSESTLKRDLQCLVGTYTTNERQSIEDAVASPLSSLGLVVGDGGAHYLREGRHPSLPAAVFAYAVLDYWKRVHPQSETLAVRELLHAPGSPGRVFLLGEEQAFELVTQAEALDHPSFRYAATAGMEQLYRIPGASALSILTAAYAVSA